MAAAHVPADLSSKVHASPIRFVVQSVELGGGTSARAAPAPARRRAVHAKVTLLFMGKYLAWISLCRRRSAGFVAEFARTEALHEWAKELVEQLLSADWGRKKLPQVPIVDMLDDTASPTAHS